MNKRNRLTGECVYCVIPAKAGIQFTHLDSGLMHAGMTRRAKHVRGKGSSSGKIIKLIIAAILIMNLSLLPQGLAQQEQALPPLDLATLTESAQARNPEILAAKAQWLASGKRVWIETALPDPVLEFAPGSDENRFSFMQEIPFAGKLFLKGKMASRDSQAAYFRYRAMERDIANRLAKAYYDLYFTDASIQVIEEIKELLKRFESVASAGYANRTGSQRDVAKAQAEVSLSLEKLYGLRQQRESTAAVINALLNRDPLETVSKASLPPKPVLNHTLIELVNLAVKNRQEIREAEALVSRSTYAKRLARLAYIPDLEVGFEYNQVKMEDKDDYWMVPLKFNVPLWQNRIIPEIQEAKQLEEAGKAGLIQAKNSAFAEVKDAYYRYDSAVKIADLYETAVIPQARIALNADLAGYESGKTDFLNLLDSERIYLNAKLSQIQFFTEALKAHADLMRATGLDFEPALAEGEK